MADSLREDEGTRFLVGERVMTVSENNPGYLVQLIRKAAEMAGKRRIDGPRFSSRVERGTARNGRE
jgi:hypothetical protein